LAISPATAGLGEGGETYIVLICEVVNLAERSHDLFLMVLHHSLDHGGVPGHQRCSYKPRRQAQTLVVIVPQLAGRKIKMVMVVVVVVVVMVVVEARSGGGDEDDDDDDGDDGGGDDDDDDDDDDGAGVGESSGCDGGGGGS